MGLVYCNKISRVNVGKFAVAKFCKQKPINGQANRRKGIAYRGVRSGDVITIKAIVDVWLGYKHSFGISDLQPDLINKLGRFSHKHGAAYQGECGDNWCARVDGHKRGHVVAHPLGWVGGKHSFACARLKPHIMGVRRSSTIQCSCVHVHPVSTFPTNGLLCPPKTTLAKCCYILLQVSVTHTYKAQDHHTLNVPFALQLKNHSTSSTNTSLSPP